MQKEVIIKKVPVPKIIYYVISLVLSAAGIAKFLNGDYLLGAILILLSCSFVYLSKWEPKKAQILIKITDEKLWTRNRGNKLWSTILCIKFRYEGKSQVYMDVYRSNEIVADEELNLQGINISIWRLKRILRRYVKVENH